MRPQKNRILLLQFRLSKTPPSGYSLLLPLLLEGLLSSSTRASMNKVALVLRGTAFLLDFAVCVLAIMYFCAAAAILCSFDGFDGVPKAPQREPVAENWLFPLSVVIWFAARDAFSRRGLPSFLRLFGFRQLVSARTQIGTMALAVARSSLFFAVPLLLVAYSTSGLGLWQTLFGIFAIPVSVASTTNGRGLHDLASGTTCTRSVTVATGQQEPTRWLRSVGSVLIWFAVSGALSLGLQLAAPRFFARYNAAVEEIVGQSKRLSVLTRDEQETLRLTNTGAGFYIENRSPIPLDPQPRSRGNSNFFGARCSSWPNPSSRK